MDSTLLSGAALGGAAAPSRADAPGAVARASPMSMSDAAMLAKLPLIASLGRLPLPPLVDLSSLSSLYGPGGEQLESPPPALGAAPPPPTGGPAPPPGGPSAASDGAMAADGGEAPPPGSVIERYA